jgi:hypothetical protein
MTGIRRFKNRGELTLDEELAVVQAQRADKPLPRFETDEYRQARREALEDAGLDPGEEDTGPVDPAEMTPAQHFERIRKSR